MSSTLTVNASCGCEPCEFDLDDLGFKTEWEDPAFAKKGCLWHKVIKTKSGQIAPDRFDDGTPALSVQVFEEETFTVPVRHGKKWAKLLGAKRK